MTARTWLARGGTGVAVIAALAVGRVVTDAWTGGIDTRAFVHHAKVGERVPMRYADVRVESVTGTKTIATTLQVSQTTGVWLVMDITLWAKGEPMGRGGLPPTTAACWQVHDTQGRVFEPDTRSGFGVLDAQTLVPWHLRLPVEMPADALAGAALRVSASCLDQRRDDQAVIDLGIDDARAAELDRLTDLVQVGDGSAFPQPDLPRAATS